MNRATQSEPRFGEVTAEYPCGYGYCTCGCGQVAPVADRTDLTGIKGWHRKFVNHHNSRGAHHHSYNGGLSFNKVLGRWIVYLPDGRQMTRARYIAETRIVQRPLAQNEVVHHINWNPTDDRPENLAVITRGEHATIHARRLSDDDMLQLLRAFAHDHGRFPTARDCCSGCRLPSYTSYTRRFGSWRRAVALAKR
jgi:hypothetical protein